MPEKPESFRGQAGGAKPEELSQRSQAGGARPKQAYSAGIKTKTEPVGGVGACGLGPVACGLWLGACDLGVGACGLRYHACAHETKQSMFLNRYRDQGLLDENKFLFMFHKT